MSRGYTLLELLIALSVLLAVTAVALRPVQALRDRLAVSRAANEVVAVHRMGRMSAMLGGWPIRLEITEDSLMIVAEVAAGDSILDRRPGPGRYRVRMTPSRPAVRFYPNGVGLGAANTRIALARGAAADTLFASRLGRLRRAGR